MDLEEIDYWYTEKKSKYLEKLDQKIKKGANVAKSKKAYTKRIKALHKKYLKKSQKAIDKDKNKKLRKARLKLKLKPLMDRLGRIKERFEKQKEEE